MGSVTLLDTREARNSDSRMARISTATMAENMPTINVTTVYWVAETRMMVPSVRRIA